MITGKRKLIRTDLQNFDGYVPGEQPQEEGWIKLNTNENPYPPPLGVGKVLHHYPVESLRKYPDPMASQVRKTAAEVYGCSPEQIIVGNGSDEILALILRACMDPGDRVMVFYPSYTLYKTLARANGGVPFEIQLAPDFSLPDMKEEDLGQIIFIPNPNSPTGTLFNEKDLKWLCEHAPGVVVIDEAYAEFAGISHVNWIDRYENCIITRTLSKSYSLCGIRMGFGFASEAILPTLYAIKDSYNVNAITQSVGLEALLDQNYLSEMIEKVVSERKRLTEELSKLGFNVYPSSANFILTECPPPGGKEIYKTLKNQRILVRYFEEYRLDNALRITIGQPDWNDALLAALRKMVK